MPQEQLKAILEAFKADTRLQEEPKATAAEEMTKAKDFTISAKKPQEIRHEMSENELKYANGGRQLPYCLAEHCLLERASRRH